MPNRLTVQQAGSAFNEKIPDARFPLLTERRRCILISDTDMSKPNDLVQGTLDLLLLKILALEALHGWASVSA